MHQYDLSARTQGIRWTELPTWIIPLIYSGTAILLGMFFPRIEASLFSKWTSPMTVSAATAIYGAVATGMITLTGLVFSMVFVVEQFSATAYSPRLVAWMSRDALLFHAIGVFTATFLYSVAALAWVDRLHDGKVPFFSVWLTVGLLLASVAMFVGLVQRLHRLQVDSVLNFTGDFGRRVIEVVYPPLKRADAAVPMSEFEQLPVTQNLNYSGPPRTIQALNAPALLALAERSDSVIEMIAEVGETLVDSTPLLRVYGAREMIRDGDLLKAIKIGTQRTFEQDPKYSIHLLADIALRALSAAVNDPTTAVQALDQIEDLLLRLGRRCLEIGEIRNSAGQLMVVISVPSWEDFLNLAFSEIRACGKDSMQVVRRMNALLADLITALPEERHSALRSQQKRLRGAITRSFPDMEDQLEASAEDREGFGATRKRPDEVPSELHPAARA
ncbi:MAG TPA: DUF2254 domain-containing protein [Terriglobales bacterium]|nr:DUF2254 domain-containing protein [Terriglobales bacterium]